MAGIEDLSPADQRLHRIGKILMAKPEVAGKAKRLIREADPTIPLPELDLEDQIAAASKETNDKIEALARKNMELEAVNRRNAERALAEKEGLDPEVVEKLVVDEKCSFATARKMAALQMQTADPGAGDVQHGGGNVPGQPIDLRPEKDVRKLQGGALRKWSSDLAHGMVDQFAKARRAAR